MKKGVWSKELWLRAEGEFNELFELDEPARMARLEELKQSDEELFKVVSHILKIGDQTGGVLGEDAFQQFNSLIGDLASDEKVFDAASGQMEGRMVGKFRILRQIGMGGMGTVFLAERADGTYERNVALKFIRSELRHDLVLERFNQEQRIQAMLSHPSIPSLFDAGTDEYGTPYIVMEYVDGVSILEYVSREKPEIPDILKLFVNVCEVVHYAHQNLVIHRDIKPSNILITSGGECKLLDFGIAKLLDYDPDRELTKTHLRFFSAKYSAPEQFRREPVTTATDIYSLGVVLYELLCGILPYDADSGSMAETERVVCEEPLTRPSSRVLRQNELLSPEKRARLSRLLRGDLDRILLKALEKEPSRRYSSVQAFADDIQRFLNHQPVLARPGGLFYSARKYIQRNTFSAVTAILIFLATISGLFFHSARVGAERDAARLEAQKFEEMANFMIALFDYDDLVVQPEDATIANLLDVGVQRLNAELSEYPEVKADILVAIGKSFLSLGNPASAQEVLEEAVSIKELYPTGGNISLGQAYYHLATALTHRIHPDMFDIINTAREYVEAESGRISHDYALLVWLQGYAMRFHTQDRTSEMEEIFDEYLDIMTRVFPETDENYGLALFEHALYRIDLRERADGLLRALEFNLAMHGDRHPRIGNIYNSLGMNFRRIDADSSLMFFSRGIEVYESLYGDAHYRTINILTNYSFFLQQLGRFEESIAGFHRAIEAARRVYRPGSVRIADPQYWLASTYLATGELDKAEETFREVLEVFAQNYEPGLRKVEMARTMLGYVKRRNGKDDAGRLLIEKSIENTIRVHGENHSMVNFSRARL